MQAAAGGFVAAETANGSVSMRETVSGCPDGEVSYVVTISEGRINVSTNRDLVADVTFTQDYDTASAIHRGELATHEAFFAGRVRVAGRLNTLLENSEALHGISEAFAAVRSR